MKTKKKLIISLSIALAVLLISVVAIVAVAAATNQNIKSNVKVSFKPSAQVIGYVSATYKFGNLSNKMTTDGKIENEDNQYVWFAYREKPTTKTLQLQTADLKNGKLELSTEVKEVILAFQFTNTGYSDFTAYLDIESTGENIDLLYSYDNKDWSTEKPAVFVERPMVLERSVENCYVKIRIANLAQNAEFDGSFIWDLVAEED